MPTMPIPIARKIAHHKSLNAIRGKGPRGRSGPAQNNGGNNGTPTGQPPTLDQIIQGDCIELMNAWPTEWVDLVFADPPFNIGYLYDGYDDQKNTKQYLDFSKRWMAAVARVLKPTGSFYLAIGDDYAADLCVIARRELGLHLRNWIIWHYTFGQQPKRKFARSHTHILYFTKDPTEFTFNRDAVRVASARQTTYKDARANPKGKLPDDVWYLRPQETPEPMFDPTGDTWNVSRVCGTFLEREGWHGCQMPIGVLNRIVIASSNPGDIVLDPFNGSGTTPVAAATLGRQYLAIDQSAGYVAFARKRLKHILQQLQQSPQAHKDAPNSHAPGSNGSVPHRPAESALFSDGQRESRVMTTTDALGRPRVPRARIAQPRVTQGRRQ
jgi:site-specific DNA-methyltransferase (adenine-specific)